MFLRLFDDLPRHRDWKHHDPVVVGDNNVTRDNGYAPAGNWNVGHLLRKHPIAYRPRSQRPHDVRLPEPRAPRRRSPGVVVRRRPRLRRKERRRTAALPAKLDARSLANAEETYFTEHQSYLPLTATIDILELGNSIVRLSPTDTATVTLNTAGTAYCIVVTTKSPTSPASSSVVYVSSKGGLLPSSVTRCPAAGNF